MDRMDVAKKIAKVRLEKGCTQKEIADKIGKSETTVGNYETGKIDIPLSAMLDIAEALDVEPAVLVGADLDDFGADVTVRAYREEDRRTLLAILGMNGYTVRQIKVAREGKRSSWYCIQAKIEEGNLMSQ